jgi:hypothetical protein
MTVDTRKTREDEEEVKAAAAHKQIAQIVRKLDRDRRGAFVCFVLVYSVVHFLFPVSCYRQRSFNVSCTCTVIVCSPPHCIPWIGQT